MCEYASGIWGPEAENEDEGYPVIRSTEISGMYINPNTALVRKISKHIASKYTLKDGDILVNKSSGSPHLVGWAVLFKKTDESKEYLFSNFMLRLRAKQDILLPHFCLYYLHSPSAREIYLKAQDTTTGLRNLRVREFIQLPVPLPPLQEQKRKVQKLEQVHRIVREALREKKQMEEEVELLEKSVLDRAFRGGL
ncbi:MAG: restriction endonuclease subunit S [Aquificaceae bacterium]|nr:restriction endonuclease subunit S [Aquificaceae bacterium]